MDFVECPMPAEGSHIGTWDGPNGHIYKYYGKRMCWLPQCKKLMHQIRVYGLGCLYWINTNEANAGLFNLDYLTDEQKAFLNAFMRYVFANGEDEPESNKLTGHWCNLMYRLLNSKQ